MKILAAMSGGVDSAVAAARAKDAGHEVVGVHLALNRNNAESKTGASKGCCTIEDAIDARVCAEKIGIPFYVWDFSKEFQQEVMSNFIAEYQDGRTPNPCLRCNEKIKFSALLNRALALGFDSICTGHYAHTFVDDDGLVQLHRASSWAKDQSYVLAVLDQQQLRHCYFPLGATPSKDLVRQEAADRGFRVAKKPDSHDICFIPDSDTKGWLSARLGEKRGDIVSPAGQKLGEHEGAFAYTVGQRRGLHLSRPAPDGRPRFVLDIQPATNTVVVGAREQLQVREISGEAFTTTGWQFSAEPQACSVQVRAHADPVPARVHLDFDARLVVRPDEPLFAVARGQSAALYRDTRVLGQLTIDAVERVEIQ